MTAAKLLPALALGIVPLFAQTNAVNVDQVVTLQANLSSLNENPPVIAGLAPGVPAAGQNTISTGTARVTIRFIGGNSTNTNPVTGTPLPVTGTTTNVTRATVSVSLSSTFVNSETIMSFRIERAPGTTTNTGTTTNPSVFTFTLPTAAVTVGSGIQNNATSNQFDVTTTAQLNILREIVNNPGAFVINIQTTASPNGLVSGTLRRTGDTADDLTSSRLDLLTRLVVRMAYAQGIITLAERDAYLAGLPPQQTPGSN